MSGLATYQFDPSIFEAVGHDRVSWGPTVFARNIEVTGYPLTDPDDGNVYPASFDIEGLRYYYEVHVWTDKVEIAVWSGDPRHLDTFRKRSTMRPRNQSELLEALDTIGDDFDDWLVAHNAA